MPINKPHEEENTQKIILIGSTMMVIVVSVIVAYVLISSEIHNFKDHLKNFKETLIEREKLAIKAVVNNLISDIEYTENLRYLEIKKRVKDRTIVASNLIEQLLLNTKEGQLTTVIDIVKKISRSNKIEFFIYKDDGTLLFNDYSKVKIGDNFIDLKDIDGKKFVKNIVTNAGYVDYLWFVSKNNKVSKKLTYSIKMDKLGIIIGSAEFLDTKYSLNKKLLNKINQESFGENDFVFIYEIMSLSSSKNYSKLILEKNIITDERELLAIENILDKSNYSGNIFYEYDNKLVYSSFLFDYKTFISAGVDLNSIKKIINKETEISNKNLNKKIISLLINLVLISIVFFIFSFLLAKKIEKMFSKYRIRIAKSQQLLIQKSKMESMGEMIGNIAHQWRQPLTQLSGVFLDIESAHKCKELNTQYLENRVDQANDLLEYMSKTIDDFKEFYNPNAKSKKFSIEKSTLSAINIIKSSLKFYKINIKVDIDSSLHVEGFCNEFSQVILNLISNSRDMAIQRKIKNPQIEISSKLNKNKLSLYVIDNCGGIDEEILEKIFEPYFTTKYTYGTGIGLYMCQVIIDNKMNGKIFASNLDKNKSKFTIILDNCYKI